MDDQRKTSVDFLQVLREGMAVVISMVILTLAAWTISKTFIFGGNISGGDAAARQEQIDAYNRQKDIMLYVVSLFGTVTGYYLGRVPAEVNARRAEKAANAAQQQLSASQEKLGEAAASASAASAQLSVAREEKARTTKRLKQSAGELRNVSETIGKLRRTPASRVDRGMGIAMDESPGLSASAAAADVSLADLQEAKRRIDALLAGMEEEV